MPTNEAWAANLGPYRGIARAYGDIVRGDPEAASRAALAEFYPAWIFGYVLTSQPEFWTHLSELRAGVPLREIARRYIRRDRGHRIDTVAAFLERAASANPPTKGMVETEVWNTGTRAWRPDAPLEIGQPQRRQRWDATETIARGAVRVVRRGAGRCSNPECSPATFGVLLAAGNQKGLCSACASQLNRPCLLDEAEKTLWMHLVPAVLSDAPSPVRRRRERRAA